MAIEWVSQVLMAVGVYLVIGVLFAVLFLMRGVGKLDPAARDGSRGFRIMIFPGVVALWPLLAWLWHSHAGAPPEERNAHRARAGRQV